MDGFTRANAVSADPTGRRSMGYYSRKDLPFYNGLYRTFAISDRYFSSVLSQTFPNRFFLLAGTSFGHIRNDLPANANQFCHLPGARPAPRDVEGLLRAGRVRPGVQVRA